MKIHEFIEQLEKLDPDALIVGEDCGTFYPRTIHLTPAIAHRNKWPGESATWEPIECDYSTGEIYNVVVFA